MNPFLGAAMAQVRTNIVLFPFSYLINSSSEGSRNPIADSSLQVLLVLIHYHKCLVSEGYSVLKNQVSASSDSLPKENTYFSNNPYCRALERATDCELDCVDLEGNAHSDQLVKLPFAPLFDTLGIIKTGFKAYAGIPIAAITSPSSILYPKSELPFSWNSSLDGCVLGISPT
ncbi:hypothetical protein glysoja_033993 [Glycine soja]|uniref:Dymeclin n=1 Tax=Glycine soja TaxID=3848 RepID=A0A0B2NQF6_GLYSO|nr:hypothetical protein glysoja_033993 [Glycine soja]